MDGGSYYMSKVIYYYAGRYAMIKSGLQGPPGTITYVLLQDAIVPGPRGKKPTKMKEGEYILCLNNSENVKTRRNS